MSDGNGQANRQETCARNSKKANELLDKGWECFADDEYIEALMHFSEATGFEINGKNNKEDLANLASFKGLCLHNLEKYQKAIEQFTLAIALDPKASDHYGARAVVHRSLGNLEEAQRDLEKELELELNESDAEELLVEAEFELKCRM